MQFNASWVFFKSFLQYLLNANSKILNEKNKVILDEISLFYAHIWLLFLTEGYVVHDSFMDGQKLKNPTIISSFTVSGYNEGNLGDF